MGVRLEWVTVQVSATKLHKAGYLAAAKGRAMFPGMKLTRVSSGCTIGPVRCEYRVRYIVTPKES